MPHKDKPGDNMVDVHDSGVATGKHIPQTDTSLAISNVQIERRADPSRPS
jgi:hypothetical protein